MLKSAEKSIMLVSEVSPYPFYFIPEFLTYRYSGFIGAPQLQFSLIQEWSNRSLRGAGSMASTNEMASFVTKRIVTNPRWPEKSIVNYYKQMDKLYRYLVRVSSKNPEKFSNIQLSKILTQYKKLFSEMYLWGWLPNAAEGLNNTFSDQLKKTVALHVKNLSQVNEILNVLTTTTRPMLREQEREKFWKLCQTIELNKQAAKLILNDNQEKLESDLKDNFPKIYRLIEVHRKNFAWTLFKYEGPEWNFGYLIGLIKEELKNSQPLDKVMQMKQNKTSLRHEQEKYLKNFNFSEKEQYLFQIAREFMDLKEHQKDRLFQCYYLLDPILREIARRLYLSPKQLRHMLHDEILEALRGKEIDTNSLNDRIKFSVMVLKKRRPIKFLTGKSAAQISQKTFPPPPKLEVFKGQCASPGKVEGRVCIVQEMKDMQKMAKGRILVTTRTNPNLMPAIRLASAIVADIGGVGSHAAIISRELKIPCVVGVYNASTVLKDGDKVEVDATNGVVRKI